MNLLRGKDLLFVLTTLQVAGSRTLTAFCEVGAPDPCAI